MASVVTLDEGFQCANTTAGAAGSTTGVPTTPAVGAANGWTDQVGGVANVNGNLLVMTGGNNGFQSMFVTRPLSEACRDQEVTVYSDVMPGTNGQWLGIALRYSSSITALPAGVITCQAIWGIGLIIEYTANNGSSNSQIGSTVALGSPTAGHYYALDAVIQGSTITLTLYDQGTTAPPQTGTAQALGTQVAQSVVTSSLVGGTPCTRVGLLANTSTPVKYRRVIAYSLDGTFGTTILGNSPLIKYSPYNWFTASTITISNNPGAYFETLFVSTGATFYFDTTLGRTDTYGWYRVDVGPWVLFSTANTLVISGLTNNLHLVEFVVAGVTVGNNRWLATAGRGGFALAGITLATGGSFQAPTQAPYRVVVCGDSITEGFNDTTTGSQPTSQNAMGGWGYSMRELLGCEVCVLGFASQGWSVPGNGNVPAFTSTWNNYCANLARTFTPPPDLVIIAHGQNDFTQGASAAAVQAAMATVIGGFKGAGAKAVLCLSPISGGYESIIQAGAAAAGASFVNATGVVPADGFVVDGLHPIAAAGRGIYAPFVASQVKALGLLGSGAGGAQRGSLRISLG